MNSHERRPTPRRALCAHCQRPLGSCLCHWIRPTCNSVPLRVLQHPLERGHAKGSLPLLHLSLSQCRVEIAELFSAEEQARWHQPGTWLLYPRDDALAPVPEPAVNAVQQLLLLAQDTQAAASEPCVAAIAALCAAGTAAIALWHPQGPATRSALYA